MSVAMGKYDDLKFYELLQKVDVVKDVINNGMTDPLGYKKLIWY